MQALQKEAKITPITIKRGGQDNEDTTNMVNT